MLDLKFKTVTLHHFGSYDHASINLQGKGYCAVSGKNNCTKDNAESNGSGKSFCWSGICYALTGETIQGISKNLRNVNIDDPEMYVELEFNTDGNDYIIKRGQIGSSKTLSISKNGIDISGKTFTETDQKVINELPELNKNLIASCMILGQGMPNKFSSFTPSGRKQLLEELTKSDYMIEDIKNRVANRLTELNNQVRVAEDTLLVDHSKLTTAQYNLNNIINQINTAVKPDFDTDILATETKYNSIMKDCDNTRTELSQAETDLDAANKVLLEANNKKAERLTKLNESYHAARDTIATDKVNTEAQIKNVQFKIRQVQDEVIRLESIKDVCPTCGQKLIGVEKPDTSKQKAEITSLQAEVATLTKTLEETIKPALVEKDTKYQAYLNQINDETVSDITAANTKVIQSRNYINTLKNDLNDFSHYASLENEKLIKLKYDKDNWDKWYEGLVKQKTDLEASIAAINANIASIESTKNNVNDHLAVVKKMDTLTKRDFRGYLLANIITYIDQKAKDFAEIVFGTKELNIYIDGNNLDISYCGKMIDNLSGGEKTRVDIILQLAIRNMLQNYLNFNSNILVLDEITDFLDKKSCKAVMSLLEKELTTIESVFIISHHSDELELPIDSTLQIIKNENGISTVIGGN